VAASEYYQGKRIKDVKGGTLYVCFIKNINFDDKEVRTLVHDTVP